MLFKKIQMNQIINKIKYGQIKAVLQFCYRSMKSWLGKNDIEMYSTNDDRKAVVAENSLER